jgi:hypothetical protein
MWSGPLFILDDDRPFPNAAIAFELREAFNAGLDARWHAGQQGWIAAPAGALAAPVVRLLDVAGTRKDFLLTGAGTAIAETARLLEHAGGRARVHPSAVPYDEGAA